MNRLRSTIRRKLVTSMMVTSTIVLVLTGLALVVHDTVSHRRILAERLVIRAQILAANSTAALAFENEEDATQVLAALGADRSMVAAAIYDREGRLFALYPKTASADIVPPQPLPAGYVFTRSAAVLSHPIMENGRRLGTLHLESDLRSLGARLRLYTLVVLVAVAGSMGIAFALSNWLHRGITRPVGVLAEVARHVSELKDYSIRARRTSDDELGLLTDAFNDMLGQIQGRDLALSTSEARLRAILHSALDAIVTVDEGGRILEVNPAAQKLFGQPEDQVVGRLLPALLHVNVPSRVGGHSPGKEVGGLVAMLDRRTEAVAIMADRRERWVEVAITRIPQQGEPMFTAFMRDITDRKSAEQEVHLLNANLERRVLERTAELQAANQELEAFSYSVSHDLRAPLRHVDGFADLLQRHASNTLDDKGRRYLGAISESARRMGALIDDLLSFSRMGRTEMRQMTLNLGVLVEEVRREVEKEASGRVIEWHMKSLSDVQADPAMLRLVLVNLMGNAVKYTGSRHHAVIEIGAKESEAETVIWVRDNGAGFDPAYAHKLFGVFQRLHSAEEFEGTGIGLANVRRVVQRHGGRTWAEGAVGQGATFYFSLPRPGGAESKEAA